MVDGQSGGGIISGDDRVVMGEGVPLFEVIVPQHAGRVSRKALVSAVESDLGDHTTQPKGVLIVAQIAQSPAVEKDDGPIRVAGNRDALLDLEDVLARGKPRRSEAGHHLDLPRLLEHNLGIRSRQRRKSSVVEFLTEIGERERRIGPRCTRPTPSPEARGAISKLASNTICAWLHATPVVE